MINHSFEKKFYGAYYTLCKNFVRGFTRAQIFKMGFYYDAIYESLQKLYHSMYYPFFH